MQVSTLTLYSCVRPHIIAREQLGKVLTLVSVSGQEEGEAQLLLRRLQAVEEEVRGGEEKKEERLAREEERRKELESVEGDSGDDRHQSFVGLPDMNST